MRIDQLIEGLPIRLTRGRDETVITDVVDDSRDATPGCLFIARSGHRADGRQFIPYAVKMGAAAVLTDDPEALVEGPIGLLCEDVPAMTAVIAERFLGHPSRQLRLVGITGTNGKTTTAYLIHQLLNGAGNRCGLIGTVQIDDGAGFTEARLTTPPALEISRLLRSMVENGCQVCVMEASSHAMHQKRTAGLDFEIGVFTNLTGDHLDYHGSMENYLQAKAILFESLPENGWAVLNAADPASEALARRCKARIVTCNHPQADCRATIGSQTMNGAEVTFDGPWGRLELLLPLIGRHNIANALQAAAVCHILGMDAHQLRAGLSSCQAPPGRLEPVASSNHGFAVLVDYAHTDDALENVLRSLRPIVPAHGKLRLVFGCGGDRDRTKRPRMGAIASKLADDVIITSDNPRTEDPQAIIDEIRGGIAAGIPSQAGAKIQCIVDRQQAIETAVDRIEPGDVLLIAGKGHEDYQIIGRTRRTFDDRIVAAQAIAEKASLGDPPAMIDDPRNGKKKERIAS